MKIPRAVWLKYKNALAAVDRKAAADMDAYIKSLGDIDEIPWQVVEYAFALTDVYGEAAGAAACEMYEAVAQASGVKVPPAEMASLPDIREVAKVVKGAFKNGSEKVVPGAVSRMVKQVGADTMLKNAKRDGAEFAWVPAGDTCPFCITLASRGWQRISKAALKGGHAEHIHANCDCTYAVRFDKKTTVEGYEPEKYREMYENAEGETAAEKMNSMRREAAKSVGEAVMFHTYDDPIREKMGSAYESHPKEMQKIIRMLQRKGVEVVERPGSMSYSPEIRGGKPGRIIIDPEASYSAWLHELKHMSDDEASGWQGFRLIQDSERFAAFEDAAYDVELDFARRKGYNKIVRRLERLKFERRQEILGIQRNNKQAHE